METLEPGLATGQLNVSSVGPQADSKVPTQPVFSFPRATRKGRENVYISKKHPQDLLGKDSPGHVYDPNRLTYQPHYGFGTSEARPHIGGAKYPEASNDLIQVELQHGSLSRYKQMGTVTIGSSTRHSKVNAPDMVGFPMGIDSPGPQRYKSCPIVGVHRHRHAPKVDQTPPSYTIRTRTSHGGVKDSGDTPDKVGPGCYDVVRPSVGEQLLSTKSSPPKYSVHKMDRFQRKGGMPDSGRLWDGEGEMRIKYSRRFSSAPSIGFGTSTRAAAQRVGIVRTALDRVC